MSVSNSDVAQVFDEIADLLEIQGENAFRIRAYRNAARLVEGLGDSLMDMLGKGEDLTELPGIGKDLAAKIAEIGQTGTCAAREELRKQLPPTITTLLKIPGLGPKRVQALYRQLDISTPEQLYTAVKDGKVRELPGFGEKTQATILQALGQQIPAGGRFPLAVAAQYAEPLRTYLGNIPGVSKAVLAGSYRRCRETVGDLDILATAEDSDAVMDAFCRYAHVAEVKSKGDTRATVVLANGLQVDLRVVAETSFGAALYYFTGSKNHNVAVRRIAQQQGLKINEYGVFRGKRRTAGDTETSVFQAVGLPFIPPELRENRGEIEAAQAGTLPTLIASSDLRGDLNVARDDLAAELPALVRAAKARGLHYLALTCAAKGTNAAGRERWIEAIEGANETSQDFTLLKGIVADITEDGTLDLPAANLDRFDLIIGALNSAFDLSRAKQTRRVLRALEHPRFTLLAHPTGRVISAREPCDLDMPRVIRAARQRKCFLELDSRPERLDLPDVYCRLARDEGVLIAINSGARRAADLAQLDYGIGQARRGWLEAANVINARPVAEVRRLVKATRL